MTPDQRAQILDSLRAGCSLALACRGARVSAVYAQALAGSDAAWAAEIREAEREGQPLMSEETLRHLAEIEDERAKKWPAP